MLQIGFYTKITVLRLQLLFFYTAFIMVRLNICSMHQCPLSSTLHFFRSVNTMLSWKHHLCKGLVPTLHRQIATHDHVASVYDVVHLSYLTVCKLYPLESRKWFWFWNRMFSRRTCLEKLLVAFLPWRFLNSLKNLSFSRSKGRGSVWQCHKIQMDDSTSPCLVCFKMFHLH